jgi:hypothetical protein
LQTRFYLKWLNRYERFERRKLLPQDDVNKYIEYSYDNKDDTDVD